MSGSPFKPGMTCSEIFMNFKKVIFSLFFALCAVKNVQAEAQPSNAQELVGKKAPIFKAPALLPDGTICNLNLQDYIGKKVVLYFYPVDDTPGCTKQAKNFRDGIAKLYDQDIVLIGISCDSIKSHQEFQAKHKLPFPLVSDSRWKRIVAKMYGVAGFLYCKRRTFLINENGTIFKAFDKVNIEQQIEEILKAFAHETSFQKTCK